MYQDGSVLPEKGLIVDQGKESEKAGLLETELKGEEEQSKRKEEPVW